MDLMANRPYRILIVDDVKDWQDTLKGLLAPLGYSILTVGSSDEALTCLASDPYDLALLDMRLDETDEDNREGLELARQIHLIFPQVKVIIITGYETQSAIDTAMQSSARDGPLASDFVLKADSIKIVDIVRQVLE
jgi:CheY-like chemotaxis protein